MAGYSFRGASNKKYAFALLDITEAWQAPRQAAVYIFASGTAVDPFPVFITETPNLRKALNDRSLWDAAQEAYGATLLYFRCEPKSDAAARKAEADDLIARYRPPMIASASGTG